MRITPRSDNTMLSYGFHSLPNKSTDCRKHQAEPASAGLGERILPVPPQHRKLPRSRTAPRFRIGTRSVSDLAGSVESVCTHPAFVAAASPDSESGLAVRWYRQEAPGWVHEWSFPWTQIDASGIMPVNPK